MDVTYVFYIPILHVILLSSPLAVFHPWKEAIINPLIQ